MGSMNNGIIILLNIYYGTFDLTISILLGFQSDRGSDCINYRYFN